MEDPEGNVRRTFYKTQRDVRTANSEQVRQPIFRDGLCQWRNYEDDALISYRR